MIYVLHPLPHWEYRLAQGVGVVLRHLLILYFPKHLCGH